MAEEVQKGSLIELAVPYKCFPKGVRGWVSDIISTEKKGSQFVLVLFHTVKGGQGGGEVHWVNLPFAEASKIIVTGFSELFPSLATE